MPRAEPIARTALTVPRVLSRSAFKAMPIVVKIVRAFGAERHAAALFFTDRTSDSAFLMYPSNSASVSGPPCSTRHRSNASPT